MTPQDLRTVSCCLALLLLFFCDLPSSFPCLTISMHLVYISQHAPLCLRQTVRCHMCIYSSIYLCDACIDLFAWFRPMLASWPKNYPNPKYNIIIHYCSFSEPFTERTTTDPAVHQCDKGQGSVEYPTADGKVGFGHFLNMKWSFVLQFVPQMSVK